MNYEALGIYTQAEQEYKSLRRKRAVKAGQIARDLRRITEDLNLNPPKLDTSKLLEDTLELKAIDEEMISWISRANSVCEECGKDKIEFSSF